MNRRPGACAARRAIGRVLRGLATALALGQAGAAWAQAAPVAPASAAAEVAPVAAASAVAAVATAQRSAGLARLLDPMVRAAEDALPGAVDALQALPLPEDAAGRRLLALARAEAAAQAAPIEPATRARAAAVVAARALQAELAAADDLYLQALRAERDDAPDLADRARAALAAYAAHCAASARPDCEARQRWRLLQSLTLQARLQRAPASARAHGRAAQTLAAAAGDAWRQAWSASELALAAIEESDFTPARRHLDEAWALAGDSDARLHTRLLFTEARLTRERGDNARARELLQRAQELARASGSPWLQALAWVNLSDQAVRERRPAEALQAAQRGLALAPALGSARLQRALEHNAALAQVALGRASEARRSFEAQQLAWARQGADGLQLVALREFGDALAEAGDLKGALEMYHRERGLNARLMDANRDAALAELRTRYDREAQERSILQLERDNALKSAELANQGLSRRLWGLGAGVLALAMALMLLLMRRVRQSNRALERSRARLRVQSERDALTGLANRRHFQGVLAAAEGEAGFAGALLMVDIDHFKRINDEQGHAAGDAVLAEVARRIAAAVRGDDTVARWGGEEFLVLAPALSRGDTEALAQRLLQAVAAQPVVLPGRAALRVTVSIGHAVFPLAPHAVPLGTAQALNLVDMALYTAKGQGRNRAVGIVQAAAADADGLRMLEADFERAWLEGRVQLRIDPGPGA